jgi:hypothetical protein
MHLAAVGNPSPRPKRLQEESFEFPENSCRERRHIAVASLTRIVNQKTVNPAAGLQSPMLWFKGY